MRAPHLRKRLCRGQKDAVAAIDTALKTGTVGATLAFLNDPARVEQANSFYRVMLKIGGGTEQPGAALLTAWYDRNFRICASLVQRAKPGDRVVVFYGSGHSFLLRQCIREMPGYRLIEANDYLPK